MKLEIKHIAPYIEHGVRCKYRSSKGTIVGIKEQSVLIKRDTLDGSNIIDYVCLNEVRPLLKPLSELSDEEIDEIERREGIDCVNIIGFRTETLEYRTFQDLVSKHYDVFGLIDNGLAEVKGE